MRKIARLFFIIGLWAGLLAGGALPAQAGCWNPCNCQWDVERDGWYKTCDCCNDPQKSQLCGPGKYVCNRGCCDIGAEKEKPDNRGCDWGTYISCLEKARRTACTCTPCEYLNVAPANLRATPVSDTKESKMQA